MHNVFTFIAEVYIVYMSAKIRLCQDGHTFQEQLKTEWPFYKAGPQFQAGAKVPKDRWAES